MLLSFRIKPPILTGNRPSIIYHGLTSSTETHSNVDCNKIQQNMKSPTAPNFTQLWVGIGHPPERMVSELYLERDQVQVSTLAGSSSHLASGSLTSKSSPLTGHVSVLVYWCIVYVFIYLVASRHLSTDTSSRAGPFLRKVSVS